MPGGEHGRKHCPQCGRITVTSVMPNRTENAVVCGLEAKRRLIICGEDEQGTNGCGQTWNTVEVIEDELTNALTRTQ